MKYSPETPQDSAKYAVGRAAVERYAHDGARLGLGSGTTSAWMVRALGEKVAEGLQVVGVPTSTSTGTSRCPSTSRSSTSTTSTGRSTSPSTGPTRSTTTAT